MKILITAALTALVLSGCGPTKEELAQMSHDRHLSNMAVCKGFGHQVDTLAFKECLFHVERSYRPRHHPRPKVGINLNWRGNHRHRRHR